jgi:hypothetical protein
MTTIVKPLPPQVPDAHAPDAHRPNAAAVDAHAADAHRPNAGVSAHAPDAGVIEEARARQRRHRGTAGAAAVVAAALAAGGLALVGGGSGESHAGGAAARRGHPLARATRLAPSRCAAATSKLLQGAPSKSLLAILGVLRRPATAADRIPKNLGLSGAGGNAFVRYVRRTRVVNGSPYFIYPAIVSGCGSRARQGMMHLNAEIDLGGGAIGATGGGGASAADIEQGRDISTGPPGSSTSSTVTMIVPDGVAKVVLRFPAGRASGYSPKISPAVTIATAPVSNEVVVSVPRSGGGGAIHEAKVTWLAADGRVIKAFDGLQ